MRIIPNLWARLNILVPEPQCKTENDDYDLIEWNDVRQIPTQVELEAVIYNHADNEFNSIVDAELKAIDLASIRSLREYVASQPGAPQFLKDRENEAAAKRDERL